LDTLQDTIQPDLCITAAYGQYLPKRFLAAPTHGTVNIHPSLLPRWRGASPVQRSLEAGDNPVGVTVLFTVSKMDAGPIIAQEEHKMEDDTQDAAALLPFLFDVGTQSLLQHLPRLLNGEITMDTATAQCDDDVVNADMISPKEAQLRPWEETATQLNNRRRGFAMWPGVYVWLQIGDATPIKYKLIETSVLAGGVRDVTDVIVTQKSGLEMVCCDGSVLQITRLQPATRKPMDAVSFLNGLQGKTVRYVPEPDETGNV